MWSRPPNRRPISGSERSVELGQMHGDLARAHHARGSPTDDRRIAACCTVGRPHNITNQTSERFAYFKPLPVPKTLTTDSVLYCVKTQVFTPIKSRCRGKWWTAA